MKLLGFTPITAFPQDLPFDPNFDYWVLYSINWKQIGFVIGGRKK